MKKLLLATAITGSALITSVANAATYDIDNEGAK